jgi:hypothetical protein
MFAGLMAKGGLPRGLEFARCSDKKASFAFSMSGLAQLAASTLESLGIGLR